MDMHLSGTTMVLVPCFGILAICTLAENNVMAEPRDIAIFISSREPQAGNENNVDEVSHALSELEGYGVLNEFAMMQLSIASRQILTKTRSEVSGYIDCQIPSNKASFLVPQKHQVGRKLLQCIPWFEKCGVTAVVTRMAGIDPYLDSAGLGGDDDDEDDDDDHMEISDLQEHAALVSICINNLCVMYYLRPGNFAQKILSAAQILCPRGYPNYYEASGMDSPALPGGFLTG